jgi:hypothetical protein
MRLERTKRYAAALLCAVGLSFFGNTVWADSFFLWKNLDGTTVQIDEQEARNRCEQCKNARQQNNDADNGSIIDNCNANLQVCLAVNITF